MVKHILTSGLTALVVMNANLAAEPSQGPKAEIVGADDRPATSGMPLWTTSSRLLKLGEALEFKFRLPPGVTDGGLKIYPRYLEQANPGPAFKPGGDLK